MSVPSVLVASILVVGTLFSGDASSASFNCDDASSCVEEVICATPTLSEMDSTMASLYFKIKGYSNRQDAQDLLENQREWLANRNTCECNADCLTNYYEERIQLFNEVLN